MFSAVGAMVLGTLSVAVSWGMLPTLLATKAVAIKGSISLSFADLAMGDWDVCGLSGWGHPRMAYAR